MHGVLGKLIKLVILNEKLKQGSQETNRCGSMIKNVSLIEA